MGQRPDCVLCPNKGGAMKSTRSGHKWAHVSCALWIPEVSIGSVDRMEPITKISSIPQSRWALICVLCRERVGACIQCSVKTCKTAYHVTCAFQHGLEMRAIIEDENAEDGVKLRSYCQKHSLNKSKKDKGPSNNNAGKSGSDEEDTKRKKQRRDMTTEEKTIVRKKRVQEIEAEFEKHVNIRDISCHLMDVDQEAIYCIYNYWIIKRKSLRNESLIPHKWDDVDMVEHKHEPADIEKMKMFVHLRQDLERVRNLCYMVSRREKLSRSFFKMREQTFHKQISVLNEIKSNKLDESVIKAVCRANNVRSVYDKAYSSDTSVKLKLETILSGIIGASSVSPTDDRVNSIDFNGQLKTKRQLSQSGNKRTHLNGVSVSSMPMSSIMFDSVYDTFSSESDFDATKSIKSSKSTTPSIRKKPIQKLLDKDVDTKPDRRKRRVSAVSINRMKKTMESSSEDDQLLVNEKRTPKNRSLRQMERELNRSKTSGSESDELIPIRNSSGQHIGSAADTKKISTAIYSDSDESTDKEKTDNTASDSQQHSFRTKAAMKEFNVNSAKLLRDKDEEASRIAMPKDNLKEKEAEETKKKNERDAKIAKDAKDVKNKKNNSTQEILPTVQKEKRLENEVEKQPIESPENKNKKNETKKDKASDISVDLLVVPQRKAAKKASENMMRTTVAGPIKKDAKDEEKEKKEVKEIAKDIEKEPVQQEPDSTPTKTDVTQQRPKGRPSKNAQKLKTPTKDKETTSVESADTKDKPKETVNKEIHVAYVPQRQAAKKAAEHIKSGLGKPAPDSQGNVPVEEKEKPKPQPATVQNRKDEKKSVVVSSGTSSGSSSSSSSYSSSSSSSDSEDEESNSVAKTTVKDSKSDKAKDLPFLNKDTKSSGSVTSNDSSDSESESSSASNASESYKKRKRKPSFSSAKLIKQTPPKSRKDFNNKKPNRELDQSASNTETFKRDEPTTKTPTTPKSIGRGGKRSSISCNRRQSADLRSGNLAKGAKATSETTDKAKVVVPEDNSKFTKSQQFHERKSSESSPSKQKQNLLNEQKHAVDDTIPAKQSDANTSKNDETATAIQHIYDNTTFDKESRKSCELSPKKREADKKLNLTEPSPGSLEQEIIERKAELGSGNKLNKSTGNLDKLLSKRERDMKFMSSPTLETGTNRSARDVEHDNVDIKAAQSVDIEIIDITGGDEKVGINLSSFNESKPSPITTELKPIDIEAPRIVMTDDKTKLEDQMMFSPSKTKEANDSMVSFGDNNFGGSDFSIPPSELSANLSTFSFPVDNLFKQDFKEDSTKESMDLVSKLRQKFKKSQPEDIRVNENNSQIIELDTSPDNTMDTCNEVAQVDKMSEPVQDDQMRTDDGIDDADRDDNKEEKKLNHSISVPSDERWVSKLAYEAIYN